MHTLISTKISTPLGVMLLSANEEALCGAWFEGQKYYREPFSLKDSKLKHPILKLAKDELELYFKGDLNEFSVPVAPKGTEFQRLVWNQLAVIPYGETKSYSQMATLVGCRSARAVGGAIGRNPVTILIPCHRVIGHNGALTGFAGGTDRKKFLLKLESDFGK